MLFSAGDIGPTEASPLSLCTVHFTALPQQHHMPTGLPQLATPELTSGQQLQLQLRARAAELL